MYYDKEGNKISNEEWGTKWVDQSYKRIGGDQVGKYWVSTVWLGLNHAHRPGQILIFESMILDEGGVDVYCQRYKTEAEAILGHQQALAWARRYRWKRFFGMKPYDGL